MNALFIWFSYQVKLSSKEISCLRKWKICPICFCYLRRNAHIYWCVFLWGNVREDVVLTIFLTTNGLFYIRYKNSGLCVCNKLMAVFFVCFIQNACTRCYISFAPGRNRLCGCEHVWNIDSFWAHAQLYAEKKLHTHDCSFVMIRGQSNITSW